MNTEQLAFVTDNEFRYTKLYGVPGGGKTKCIIEKIMYLKQSGILETYKDYLVLTFSRQACEDFIRKGKKRDKTLFRETSIRTIHSTCSSLLRQLSSTTCQNLATLVYECHQELQNFEKEEMNSPWHHKKIIFVDEAQDISELQYQFVLDLGKIYQCPIILIGDPNQTIFQFQNGSDRFLLEHPGEAIQLTTNYRSSKEIVEFLNYFRPWDVYGYITPFQNSYKFPRIIIDTRQNILEHLVKELWMKKERYENVAIIGPIKLSHASAISLSMIANTLYQYNIPFVKHYQDSDSDHNYQHTKEIVEGKVNLFTIHGSKGLEFERVYLCNFHLETKGILPTKEEHYENRYLWFVGMSRAKKHLTIYGLKDTPLFPSIYSCPSHLYKCSQELIHKPYHFREKKKNPTDSYISIKHFLTSKEWIDEPELFHLHELFEYKKTEETLYDVQVELYEYSQYATIYGMFMDDWMFYQTVPLHHYLQCKERQIDWKVPLLREEWKRIQELQKKYQKICSYSKYLDCMDASNPIDRAILRKLDATPILKENLFEFCFGKDTVEYDKHRYLQYLEILQEPSLSFINKVQTVWKIVLFQYQFDFECKYLLEQDFSNHCITLQPYLEEIYKLRFFNSNTLFQIPLMDPDTSLKGVMDALDDKNNIYEFKFCKETNLQSFLQLFLYASIYYKHLLHKKVELWNLQTGKRYICEFTKDNSEEVKTYIEELFHKNATSECT